jgi:hypothetical protein
MPAKKVAKSSKQLKKSKKLEATRPLSAIPTDPCRKF